MLENCLNRNAAEIRHFRNAIVGRTPPVSNQPAGRHMRPGPRLSVGLDVDAAFGGVEAALKRALAG